MSRSHFIYDTRTSRNYMEHWRFSQLCNHCEVQLSVLLSFQIWYFIYFSWKCKDRRYQIKEKSTADSSKTDLLHSSCLWYKNWTILPSNLECVLSFCDNASDIPNSNGANYNFTWNGNRIPLETFVQYPCQDGMAIENSTVWKDLSSTASQAYCDQPCRRIYENFLTRQYTPVVMVQIYASYMDVGLSRK